MYLQSKGASRHVAATGSAAGSIWPSSWRSRAVGLAWSLVVVLVWAVWIVSTRAGVQTPLRAIDIAVIRYVCACAILLPLCWWRKMSWVACDVRTTALLVLGAGVPLLVASTSAMNFAKASDVASVMIGSMPFFVAILAFLVLRERLCMLQYVGFAVLLAGLLLFMRVGQTEPGQGQWRGQALALLAAAMWGVYTITMRVRGIGALHAAGVVNGWSLLLLIPVYLYMGVADISTLSVRDVVMQAASQTLSAVVGLYAYGQAVSRIGPAQASLISALAPAVAAVLAFFYLDEYPKPLAIAAILLVMAGVGFASMRRDVRRAR